MTQNEYLIDSQMKADIENQLSTSNWTGPIKSSQDMLEKCNLSTSVLNSPQSLSFDTVKVSSRIKNIYTLVY